MEQLKKLLKKSGWVSIIEAIAFAIIGIILIGNPEGTMQAIYYILGAAFVIFGICKVISYFVEKGKYDFYNNDLIYGIIAIILGIVTIVFSSTIGSIFRIAIGIWITYSALMRMSLSFKLKALNSRVWIYSLVLSIIMLVFGLYITFNAGAVVLIIGAMMVAYSIMDIIENIIFMRSIK